MRKMQEGILIYDNETDRYDIKFGLEDYFGGLHCGTGFSVYVEGAWIPTRIEMAGDWYLVGIPTKLNGLRVRIAI